MDADTLFGPVATNALAAITDVLPLAVPVLSAFVLITIALRVFGKFGIRR